MNMLLLAPHYDDEILFASYTLMRHRPTIWFVFAPQSRAERETRGRESKTAMAQLGLSLEISAVGAYEGEGIAGSLPDRLAQYLPPVDLLDRDPDTMYFDHVFAPAVYASGHLEHNSVGEVALEIYGKDRVTSYETYSRDAGRRQGGHLVEPTPDMIERKLRALACFRSQIEHPARRPWFYDMLDMREWYT